MGLGIFTETSFDGEVLRMNKQFLQVIWTKKTRLKWRDFPLEKRKQAFGLFQRLGSAQIVLRGVQYEPSFTTRMLEEPFDLWIYGTKKQRVQKFEEWLKDYVVITNMMKRRK